MSTVISFPARKLPAPAASLDLPRQQPEPITETGRNHLLRQARWKAWRTARQVTNYWQARLDWHSALSIAQDNDVADACTYPTVDIQQRWPLIDEFRTALASQMLTPAPDTAAVAWKRAQLRGRPCSLAAVNPGWLEKAIADDEQWLKEHPIRNR